MPDIKLKNWSGNEVEYSDVPKIWLADPSQDIKDLEEGEEPKLLPFTYGEAVTKQILPDFSRGNMVISAPYGELIQSLILGCPENLNPENIPLGMYIAGVGPGKFEGNGGGTPKDLIVMHGEFTSIGTTAPITITHNMGMVPDEIFITAVNPPNATQGLRWAFGLSSEFAAKVSGDPIVGQIYNSAAGINLSVYGGYGINESGPLIRDANPLSFCVYPVSGISLVANTPYHWCAVCGIMPHPDVLYLKLSLRDFGLLTVTGGSPYITQLEVYVDGSYAGVVDYEHADEAVTLNISEFGDNASKHRVTVVPVGEELENRFSKIYADTVSGWLAPPEIYGVTGMYSSSTILTRTDDAVGLTYSISTSGTVTSDFNTVFPWNVAKIVTDSQGNQFLQMPEMFFRVGYDSNYRITDIAVSAAAHPEGDWYRVAPFCYGRYGGYFSGEKLQSKSGVTRASSRNRDSFLLGALKTGENYQIVDLYHHTVMNFLWWIEFAKKDSMSIMTGRINGSGTYGGSTARSTGGTNNVSTPSGFETYYKQMRYHYIEDFIGNLMEWIEGISIQPSGSSNADLVASDPSSTRTPTVYKNSANGCIAAFGWDPEKPFLCTPCEAVSNSSYNTYFCDYVYRGSGQTAMYTGAAYNGSTTYNGTAYFYSATSSSSYASIGARLMYRGTIA